MVSNVGALFVVFKKYSLYNTIV